MTLHGRTRSRLPVLGVLAVAIGALVVVGTTIDRPPAVAVGDVVETLPADLAPVAPAASALGSTWFCAGGTATSGGIGDHYVLIANAGTEPVTANITVYAGAADSDPGAVEAVATRDPVRRVVEIGGRDRAEVRLADVLEAPFAAALVEVGRGQVAVEHQVIGELGTDVAPCATSPSASWFFAGGSTTRDARELLMLFNPFPDAAILDVTFTTPEGFRAPREYEGFVVPGERLVVLDIGAVVARHAEVATSVIARSGRLIVDRLQTFDASAGPAGIALTLGAPQASELWFFPDGFVAEGLTESVVVYNPTDRHAEVDVEITLDDPTVNGAVEPIPVPLPPRAAVTVSLSAESRIPAGIGHSIAVRGLNGVPIVAERWVRSASPAPRSGLSAMLGSPILATRWIAPVGSTVEGFAEFLIVVNPASEGIARLSITALAGGQLLAIDGLQDIELAAGQRIVLDLGARVNRVELPLVVESSLPVVVERGIFRSSGPGLAQSVPVPVEDGAVVAEP